jgi:hypothetical protein
MFRNNEEVVATRRAKETDSRRLWIPEEVGCRLQEGVLPSWSGVAQENHRQERSEQEPRGTRSPERMKRYCGSARNSTMA